MALPTSATLGKAAAGAAGAKLGAALGSLIPIPGLGTLLGGLAGSAIGSLIGGSGPDRLSGAAAAADQRSKYTALFKQSKVAGAARFYRTLAELGDCRGAGRGCKPQRAGLLKNVQALGLPIPANCISGPALRKAEVARRRQCFAAIDPRLSILNIEKKADFLRAVDVLTMEPEPAPEPPAVMPQMPAALNPQLFQLLTLLAQLRR